MSYTLLYSDGANTIVSGITLESTFDGLVSIPSGVTEILNQAFLNCVQLTTITIPSTVTMIRTAAFDGCTGLTSIVFQGNGAVLTIEANAFAGVSGTYSHSTPWNFTDINNALGNLTVEVSDGGGGGEIENPDGEGGGGIDIPTYEVTPRYSLSIGYTKEGSYIIDPDNGYVSSGTYLLLNGNTVTSVYSNDEPAAIATNVGMLLGDGHSLLTVISQTYTPKGPAPALHFATIVTTNATVPDNNGSANTILVDLSSSTYTDESGPHSVKRVVLAPSFAGNDAKFYIRVIDLSDNVISNNFSVRLVLTIPGVAANVTTSDIIHYDDNGGSTFLGNANRITGTNTFEAFVTQNAIITITTITPVTPALCFLPGTPVLTPKGCVAIENIRLGDLVRTADGRTVAVKELHRSDVKCASSLTAPYLIPAGCVAPGVPCNDVVLSPHHALQVGEGLWIEAWRCKARSPAVKQILFGKSFTYYNLGLPAATDTLVVQNGVAVESMCERRLVLDRSGFYRRANVLPIAAFKRRGLAKAKKPRTLRI